MSKVLVIGVLVTLALISIPIQPSSADQDSQNFVPSFEADDCQFKIPMGERVECGYLTVPEVRSINPNSPDFRTIRLHVAHFRSHNPNPPSDPIIYLVGGPGVSIFVEIDTSFYHFARLLDNRDVYVFDQRGIGYSEPTLPCPEDDLEFWVQSIDACREALEGQGINLSGYTTTESAADVAALRLVLGIEEWNVVGVSYGSRLALAVLRDNDAGVRSVIVDSVLPLNAPSWTEAQDSLETPYTILNTIFADCEADAACNATYPDLADVYEMTFDELSEAPVNGVEDEYDFFFRVSQRFSDTYSVQTVPHYIYTVYNDHNRLLDPALIHSTYTSYDGMALSVSCADGMSGAAICDVWGVDFDRAAFQRQVTSQVPTLILNGAYDSITPTFGAELTHESLPNSIFFEIPFTSHGVIRSGGECPRSIAYAFLDDPTQTLDASCIEEMQARFYIE